MRRLIRLTILLAVSGCSALFGIVPPTTTTTTTSTTTTTLPPTTTTTVPPTVVSGTVTDPAGRPVAGVALSFGDASGVSGPDGAFSLSTINPGPITAEKRGWEPVSLDWSAKGSVLDLAMTRATIRGIRVGAGAAGNDTHFQNLLDLAANTAINAFVFDTKQEGGEVLYQTAVQSAHDVGAVNPWYDPVLRLAQTHDAGLYAITRIVVFEDVLWIRAFPEEKMAGWWADPRAEGVRRYAIDLALEACALGFDEIQFDYVRFPAGRTAEVSGQRDIPQADRVAAIAAFLAEARAALTPAGCAVSADIFGIVASVPDDQGLGQRPEELSPHLDALSPMLYPSHYSPGWIGYPDPNDYPYQVTVDAIDDVLPRIQGGAVLRPWLQGFWWTNAQIREAIQAAEDRGVGWLVWNVGSSYESSAFPTDAETGSGG